MKRGNIIILNGVSSAGKSTLTRALQKQFAEPYFCIAQDTFTHAIAPCFEKKYDGEVISELWKQAVSAMHHTIKLYSDLGHHVIVDHVFTRWRDPDGHIERTLEECVELLWDHPVVFVKLSCPLDELRRRERQRGDRPEGVAEWQMQYLVPDDAYYDVLLDTHAQSADECCALIQDAIGRIDACDGFRRLSQRNSLI